MVVPRQLLRLWSFSEGLLLEVKFGKIAYLHVPDVIIRRHSALAHLLDRAHVTYRYIDIYTTSLPSFTSTSITVLLW